MKILFLIPARGGSKGIPGKNIKPLAGKPLIYYTIDAARELAADEDICVSTDSIEIKKVVEDYGLVVPFVRPKELATDEASTEEVIRQALNFYHNRGVKYDLIVLLQPTSPLRKGIHIKEALERFTEGKGMVVSVKETKSNPYYILFEENGKGFLEKSKEGNFTRRQDCPRVYELNGAIYIIEVRKFIKSGLKDINRIKYCMDEESSVDIDSKLDWLVCEAILNA